MRRGSLMDIDLDALRTHMGAYFNSDNTWDDIVRTGSGPTKDAGGFDAKAQRTSLLRQATFDPQRIRRYALLPLDNRWAYWSPAPSLWNRARPDLVQHIFPNNRMFILRMAAERPNENIPALITDVPPDYHLLRPNVVAIPMRLAPPAQDSGSGGLLAAMDDGAPKANLSAAARRYIATLGLKNPDKHVGTAEALWLHSLAICSSPLYLTENRDGVQANCPRVPLPARSKVLHNSASLGDRIAALLDPDHEVTGVTSGSIKTFFSLLAPVASANQSTIRPTDLALTASWGRADSNDAVMPGKGKTEEYEGYGAQEKDLRSALRVLELDPNEALILLGPPIDVYLNDRVFWSTVPSAVWEFRIGGYQVLKKWLSYREESVLGRPLSKDEVRHFSNLVRRLTALILLAPQLDANYQTCRNDCFDWRTV